jgi:hypothetical protein
MTTIKEDRNPDYVIGIGTLIVKPFLCFPFYPKMSQNNTGAGNKWAIVRAVPFLCTLCSLFFYHKDAKIVNLLHPWKHPGTDSP